MNVLRIRALAAQLRSPEAQGHFDMAFLINGTGDGEGIGHGIQHCGTVACIAGWGAIMSEPTITDDEDLWVVARDWLGISEDQANALFTPPNYTDGTITNEQAAQTLDRLAETGEVKW